MNRFKEWFAFIGFSGAMTLFLLVGLELVARFFLSTPTHFHAIGLQNFSYAYHPWSDFRNTPGFEYQKTLRINRFGWRGKEWKRKKPRGTKRLLLLGDSTAFSSGMLHEKATIAGYMQTMLRKKTGKNWEVLNMAVPGGLNRMSLASLAHDGTLYEPDAVVVLNGHNDSGAVFARWKDGQEFGTTGALVNARIKELWDPRTGRSPRPRRLLGILLYESHFFRWLSRWGFRIEFHSLANAAPKLPQIPKKNLVPDFVRASISMHRISKGLNAPFIHFLQPYLSLKRKTKSKFDKAFIQKHKFDLQLLDVAMPAMARSMVAASKKTGLKFVDLTRLFDQKDVFSDAVHMRCESNSSCRGNRLLAQAMVKSLLPVLSPSKP